MFKEITGESCIIKQGGGYSVRPLYTFRCRMFAAVGSTYVGLRVDGTTTKDKMYVMYMEIPQLNLAKDGHGRLLYDTEGNLTPLTNKEYATLSNAME